MISALGNNVDNSGHKKRELEREFKFSLPLFI